MTQEKFLELREKYLTNRNSVAADRLYKELYNIGMFMLYKSYLSVEDREDIVAMSVTAVFNGLETYRNDYSYKTWFGRIVKNKMIDCLKRNNVRGGFNNLSLDGFNGKEDFDFNPFQLPDADLNPMDWVDRKFKSADLRKKIYALPNGINKAVIVMHLIEEKSNQEIMMELNLSKSNVAQIIHRFKNKVLAKKD